MLWEFPQGIISPFNGNGGQQLRPRATAGHKGPEDPDVWIMASWVGSMVKFI